MRALDAAAGLGLKPAMARHDLKRPRQQQWGHIVAALNGFVRDGEIVSFRTTRYDKSKDPLEILIVPVADPASAVEKVRSILRDEFVDVPVRAEEG